jgi:hypothetical protein
MSLFPSFKSLINIVSAPPAFALIALFLVLFLRRSTILVTYHLEPHSYFATTEVQKWRLSALNLL